MKELNNGKKNIKMLGSLANIPKLMRRVSFTLKSQEKKY